MSKYGDEYKCTCEMDLVTAINVYHAETCDLWNEPTFKDGSDEWDGDLGCLVLNRNPWENAEEYLWDGDTPVVRKATAEARISSGPLTVINGLTEVLEEWEGGPTDVVDMIPEGEQEVLDALASGKASADSVGLIDMGDGSYADFDARVTYRKITGDDGQPTWVEEMWDMEDCFVSEGPPVECVCMPPKRFYCFACRVKRETEADLWVAWDKNDTQINSKSVGSSYTYNGQTTTTYSWSKCHHDMDSFRLPGAQHRNIKISAKHVHTPTNTPDYGLYAYSGWDPKCVATLLPWQDYGLPTVSYPKAAEAIKYAYDLATAGRIVEVGCMGGHGRTGTILACMAILSKPEMTPEDAVLWVRKVHCNEAIETNQQEWFVAWFASWYNDTPCPPMPTYYTSKHDSSWGAASTAAVAVKAGVGTDPAPKASSIFEMGGLSQDVGAYCNDCKRYVKKYHNGGCSVERAEMEALTTASQPATLVHGMTANARRRNARRANRRAAQKRQALIRTGD